MERLGQDARQVVRVADEVVVLRHRQGDAVDVDLLEGVLADQGRRHVAGDRDHRDRVEEGGPDPGHEVGGARPGRPHADPDLAGDAGIAVGGVGAALLVANEDVAELGIVAEDVVERQDHAARVAEEQVGALQEEGLADDVRPDPGPVPRSRVVEHRPAGGLDGGGVGRAVGRHMAPAFRSRLGRTGRPSRLPLRHRHRSLPALMDAFVATKNPRRPARVPLVVGGSCVLAPVPPIASVLPPGAGNEEPKKALKPDDERAKKTEERAVRETAVVQGHLDTATVRANRDGDVASIATIEQTQGWSPEQMPGRPGGSRSLRGVPCSRNHLGPMESRSSSVDLGGPAASPHSRIRGRLSETTRPSGGPTVSLPPMASSRRGLMVTSSVARPREREQSWQARTASRGPGRPEPSACESSRSAPRVRASDAMSASAVVKRARFAFTMDSFV